MEWVVVLMVVLFIIGCTMKRPTARKAGTNTDVNGNTKAGRSSMANYPPCQGYLFDPIPVEFDTFYEVKSESSDNVYQVNLHQQTCTCGDFLHFRKQFEQNDIRRPCKHIIKKLKEVKKARDHFDRLSELLLFSYRDECYSVVDVLNSKAVIGFSPGNDWVSVYVRHKRPSHDKTGELSGPYQRYGYNLVEDRWSYSKSPFGATTELKKILKNTFE